VAELCLALVGNANPYELPLSRYEEACGIVQSGSLVEFKEMAEGEANPETIWNDSEIPPIEDERSPYG
jgi:hypothetical protein